MSSQAQIAANQKNAQLSTGPTSEAGKSASSKNHFQHGLTGVFTVLDFEDQDAYDSLFHSLQAEHQPQTITESILVEKMAQAHWLSTRAQRFQEMIMGEQDLTSQAKNSRFALFLRYQTTNDRAFTRALHDLLKLRAEKRKVEIGFESQKQKQAQEQRREVAEKRKEEEAARRARAEERKQELHGFAVLLAEAKVDHQMTLTSDLTLDRAIAEAHKEQASQVKKAA